MTSKAHVFVWVCFDDHPILGRKAHYVTSASVRNHIWELRREKPTPGNHSDVGTRGTGYGYKMDFADLNESALLSIPIDKYVGYVDSKLAFDKRAVEIVKLQMKDLDGLVFRDATVTEQEEDGIDLVHAKFSIEVKSRGPTKGLWPTVYAQVSETNPEQRH
jgi:hypothetical protein